MVGLGFLAMFLKHMFRNQTHKDVVLTKHLQESCLSNKQKTEYVVKIQVKLNRFTSKSKSIQGKEKKHISSTYIVFLNTDHVSE